ncbi:hypothetical protein NDU88_002488 [Pleurodeles waltl]|uniref:Uncharacterized protein n=1 Tax=Pleurodeles waltl TaxID=8319 RepID=A0AAV7SD52_PLEWA|nr:hypothetical protein NDU88_002488 [Pleurodeles waltl]
MQLEVAAPRTLSCCLATTLILSELLLRFAPGGQLPPRGTPDQLCALGGDVHAPTAPPVQGPAQPPRGVLGSGSHLSTWPGQAPVMASLN